MPRRRAPSFGDPGDGAGRDGELEEADADQRDREVAGGLTDGGEDDAADLSEHIHHPIHGAGEADLLGRNEVGEIALEGTLGRVRGQLQ